MRRSIDLAVVPVLILIFVCSSSAGPVGSGTAIEAGNTYLQAQGRSRRSRLAPGAFSGSQGYSILGTREIRADGKILAYVLDLSPEGCIIVSSDTDITPVIAYSSEGKFSTEDAPDNVLLHLIRRDMENRLENLAITPEGMKESNNALWEKYLNQEENFIQQLSSGETWGPWLSTRWHQSHPYNKYCPTICPDDANSYVGCTATAMAQVIYYWKYPASVEFNYSDDHYETEGFGMDEDSVLSFDQLNSMLSDIKYDGNEDEIAALCLACGISVEMGYGCEGSGAVPSAEAFRDKFRYSSADYRNEYDIDFYYTLQENMKNEQPALLVPPCIPDDEYPGHALVVDGFRRPGEYHLNFGWGPDWDSIDNCWYSLPFPCIPSMSQPTSEEKGELGVLDYGILNIHPYQSDGFAEPSWATFRGNSYMVVDESMLWIDARFYAESLGGHLVTISDEAENQFVTDLAAEKGVLRFWIGLTDEMTEDHFAWVTGEPLIYENWLPEEPNNYGGDEDYVEIGYGGSYLWNDNNGDWGNPFVIEFESKEVGTFRGNYYTVVNQDMSWQEARTYAESQGGHLVTISDDEENQFVADLVGVLRSCWIGLADEMDEGHFVWVTGEPLTYTNWGIGQPDNWNGDEDYVEIGLYNPYWNDVNNDWPRSFVVEFEGTTTPAETVVAVQSDFGSFNKGAPINIGIHISGVTDMAGFQLDVTFDPSILETAQVEEGTFLSNSGGTYWLEPNIDNTAGMISGILCAKSGKGGVDGSGTLATIIFEAVGAGETYIGLRSIKLSDSAGKLIPATTVDISVTVTEFPPWDVNGDGRVDVLDFVLVGQHFGETITTPLEPNPDVSRDGEVDILDFVLVGQHFGEVYTPAAPPGDIWSFDTEYLPVLIKVYNIMKDDPSSDPGFLTTRRLLHRLIRNVKVSKTQMFQNYPNPFNPETWIPYQLAEDLEVTIKIYNMAGQLVKFLDLGYKRTGSYMIKDTAAYWNGTTDDGERASSGIYFYNIQAGDYNVIRKMIAVQ